MVSQLGSIGRQEISAFDNNGATLGPNDESRLVETECGLGLAPQPLEGIGRYGVQGFVALPSAMTLPVSALTMSAGARASPGVIRTSRAMIFPTVRSVRRLHETSRNVTEPAAAQVLAEVAVGLREGGNPQGGASAVSSARPNSPLDDPSACTRHLDLTQGCFISILRRAKSTEPSGKRSQTKEGPAASANGS